MRALIIDKEPIKRLREYAEANPIEVNAGVVLDNKIPRAGDNPLLTLEIPVGYRICFSVEKQKFENQPLLHVRHLSVSVDDPKKLPSIPAVEAIMKELGFVGNIDEQENVWIEDERAINVIQIIND